MPRNELSLFDKKVRNIIAKNLKKLSNGKTQNEISDATNIPASTLSGYFASRSTISTKNLQILSDYFNVPKSFIDPRFANTLKEDKTEYLVGSRKVPLIGTIAAGTPILASENIEDYFLIDSCIKADFALRIKGDSMINVGIHHNDIVFIRKQSTLENGEIGAILLPDENKATLKRFYKADDHYILQPENNQMTPFLVKDEVQILGKYIACLHIESNK